MTELWFRNILPYTQQLKDSLSKVNAIFDTAYLQHHGDMKPLMLMSMSFGIKQNWQYMVAYGLERYAIQHDNSSAITGIFPIWNAAQDDTGELLEYVYDASLNNHPDGIIEGQEHRILIENLNPNTALVRELMILQKRNPEVKFHMFNGYSFQIMFGMGFHSADFNAVTPGKDFYLPSGRRFRGGWIAEDDKSLKFWVESMGFKVEEVLNDRQIRIKYNVVSAIWAAKFFNELPNVKRKLGYVPIADAVGKDVLISRLPRRLSSKAPSESDEIACDFCSLWNTCKYYREGSVCMMPGSDYSNIVQSLGSRDAFTIAQGISELLKVNVDRISEARDSEKNAAKAKQRFLDTLDDEDAIRVAEVFAKGKATGVLDPELTKLIDSTVKQAMSLANLYKAPSGGNVVIQVSGVSGSAGELTATPSVTRELAARAVAELEESGIPRDEITEEHVNEWLSKNIIEGNATEGEEK